MTDCHYNRMKPQKTNEDWKTIGRVIAQTPEGGKVWCFLVQNKKTKEVRLWW